MFEWETDGIRQKTMAVHDATALDRFLRKAFVGYLGLVDGTEPYVVPLNFVWVDDMVYFHGAGDGRKAGLMRDGASATFVVARDYGIMTSPVPAHLDTAYTSVMLFGKAQPVTGVEEATRALQAIINKYVPGYYDKPLSPNHVASYVSSLGSPVQVYKLIPQRGTAKTSPPEDARLFYGGKTIKDDR